MDKYFALIKSRIVKGIIIADDDFILLIQDDYDLIIDVTNIERPAVGDSYYSETNEFIKNDVSATNIPFDEDAEHLKGGTEDGFEPFNLSKYSVSYSDGIIKIGCKSYSAPGFLDSLHKVLINDHSTTSCFTIEDGVPSHGKFSITWDDAKLLYDALSKVKF